MHDAHIAVTRPFRIWELRNALTGETLIKAYPWEPHDIEHEFQRILYECDAHNATDAIKQWEKDR